MTMTMKKCLITAGLVFSLNPLLSFAVAPVEDYSEPATEIQDGGVSLSKTFAHDSKSGSLSERLQRVESKVDHLTESNVTARMEELQQTIQELRGELEKQAHALEQLNTNQKNFYKDLSSRIVKTKEVPQVSQAEGEAVPATTPVKTTANDEEAISLSRPVKAKSVKESAPIKIKAASLTETAPVTAPVSAPVKSKAKNPEPPVSEAHDAIPVTKPASNPATVSANPKPATVASGSSVDAETAVYQQGFALLKSKQYDRALSQFKDYLKQYSQGRYAANAHFWTGEINYLQGKHVVAKKSFETVVKNYPKDSKMPDALLKLAIIETDTGHKQKAEEMLQTIQKKYPGTTAARLAMIRAQELRLSMSSVSR